MKKTQKKNVNFLKDFDFSEQKEKDLINKKDIIRDSIEVGKNLIDNTFVSEKLILGNHEFGINKKNSVQTKLGKKTDNIRFSTNTPYRKFTFEKSEKKNILKKKEKKIDKTIFKKKIVRTKTQEFIINSGDSGINMSDIDIKKKFITSGKLSFDSFKEKNEIIDNVNYNKNLLDTFNPDYFKNDIIITIVIFSNWGYINKIGINQIKLFDKNLSEIKKKFFSIKLFKNEKEVKAKNLNNVINKKIKSFYDKDNFTTDFENNSNYKIVITVQDNIKISSICFWNYFKNENMGIKQCKIYYNENLIFDNDIQKSSNSFNSSHTLVKFIKDIDLKKLNFIIDKIWKASQKKDVPLIRNNQLPTFENPKKRKKNSYYPKSSDIKLKKKKNQFLIF